MLAQSQLLNPGENPNIPITSSSAMDMTVIERQIAHLHWQHQQQQQASYSASLNPNNTSFSNPEALLHIPPCSYSCGGDQGMTTMMGHQVPAAATCAWAGLTHQPMIGNVDQLEHASTTHSPKKRKYPPRATTHKLQADDTRCKRIKVENSETGLLEAKHVFSPPIVSSSTVVTTENDEHQNGDCRGNYERLQGSSRRGGSKEESKVAEPPQAPKSDYIHVRARRGQATDSHSLAERVRREKISERMKMLQELVPGCNKITGKAGMLDEIINYVQSLQRQVEFLSMKLAVVTPTLEFGVLDALFNKEVVPAGCGGGGFLPTAMGMMPSEVLELSLMQLQQQALEAAACGLSLPPVITPSPTNPAEEVTAVSAPPEPCPFVPSYNAHPPSTPSGWDDELQRFYSSGVDELVQGRPGVDY